MSGVVEPRSSSIEDGGGLIGPGRLVLVVGPSGAGKDTLISGARAACRDDPDVIFPRRAVTRQASGAEDHHSVSVAVFEQAVAAGAFSLWWEAHGHKYGIPASIELQLCDGRTVVCNVSRTIIAQARQRYAAVVVVLVTATEEVLAARLAARGRVSDGAIIDRLMRSAAVDFDFRADVVIDNTGEPEIGIRQLVKAIRNAG
jgi:ribose 1,5-bisphosphokinase